jgi:tRNA(fMet)-specific endonuclease VapC
VNHLLVDTNVLSYAHNQHSLWQAYSPILEGNRLLVAAQTVAELRFGARLRNWGEVRVQRLEGIIGGFTVVHTDDDICTEWAKVRAEATSKGRPMGVADTWIAATARSLALPLVTHNRRDFDFLEGLTLISENA